MSTTSNILHPISNTAAKDHLHKTAGKPLRTRGTTHDGVGDLPGNDSEASVAKLPEERAHPDPYSENLANKSNQPEDDRHPSDLNPDNQNQSGRGQIQSSPSEIHDQGHDGIKETGTAPNSNSNPAESAESPSHHHHHHHLGLGVLHHHSEGRGVDKTMGRIGTIGEKDGDSHLPRRADRVEPAPPSPKIKTSGFALSKTISGPKSASKIEPGSDFKSGHGRSASTGSTGKPSFMDKIKGEMKVISGKITGDERKIEEGKALMSVGESPSLDQATA